MEELKAREHEQVRPWSSAGKAQHQRWFRGVCGGGGGMTPQFCKPSGLPLNLASDPPGDIGSQHLYSPAGIVDSVD